MSFKLQPKFFQIYSSVFATNVCNHIFENTEAVGGKKILDLTPIPQINLFVIQQLQHEWKKLGEAIQSPYFDLQNEQLQQQKSYFINMISQHILVERKYLEPLIEKATNDTLRLLCTPTNFFYDTLQEPSFNLNDLKKYLQINAFMVPIIEENWLKWKNNNEVEVKTAIENILKQNDSHQDNFEDWRSIFSNIEPIANYEINQTNTPECEHQLEQGVQYSFFDTIAIFSAQPTGNSKEDIEIATPVTEKVIEETIIAPNDTREHLQANTDKNASDYATPIEPVVEKSEAILEEPEVVIPHPTEPLAPKPPIASIIEHIPLHQKFLFIFSLFTGNSADYETFINELENAPNRPAAHQVVDNWYQKNNWGKHIDIVDDLEELIARKFSNQ